MVAVQVQGASRKTHYDKQVTHNSEMYYLLLVEGSLRIGILVIWLYENLYLFIVLSSNTSTMLYTFFKFVRSLLPEFLIVVDKTSSLMK
jgi:hypothetical protein